MIGYLSTGSRFSTGVEPEEGVPAGLWRRLWAHRGGRVGIILVALLILATTFGPFFAGDAITPNYANKLQPPGGAHLLGTDIAGRDLLARTLYGARTSLGSAVLVMAIVTTLGLIIGVLSGLLGGTVDRIIDRTMDLLLGLPGLVITLAIVGALGPSLTNLVVALAATGWASLAKIARAHTRGARNRPHVIAARMAGVGSIKVAFQHVIPGTIALVLVASTMRVGETVMALAALSFLGLGAQPPAAEWGTMLADARSTLAIAPFQILGPGIGLLLTVLAATLISDALRDVSDPGSHR